MTSSELSLLPVTLTGTGALNANTPPNFNWLASGSLTATPSGLFLSNDGYLGLNYSSITPFSAYIAGEIDPHDDGGAISLFASPGGNGGAATMQFFPQNLDAVYGNGSWQIAKAVPEPATMTLLGSAFLAFGGMHVLRRRQASSSK